MPIVKILEQGRVHYYLFLIKGNKEFLPPKKLTGHCLVSEEKNGQTWYHSEPWYRFVDPYKWLKGYRVVNYICKI